MLDLMLAPYKKKTNIGIGLSIALVALSFVYLLTYKPDPSDPKHGDPVILILGLAASVTWFWGFYNYAKGKGYSGWLALLGLLQLLGLLIIAFLPDKTKKR
jgi:hypothetical protein